MNKTLNKYKVCYAAHIASIALIIVSQSNHWSKWLPLLFVFITAGLFIYLFWKNEMLPREKKIFRIVLLILFFQLAAFVFIVLKHLESKENSK